MKDKSDIKILFALMHYYSLCVTKK